MKVVIFAGGLGTRIADEVVTKPKPMIDIGGKPIIWHIMKNYSRCGHNEFIICLGYKGYAVKEYFMNYLLHMSDVTIHIAENRMEVHRETAEPWHVTLIDTGEHTMTGGRLKRVMHHLADEEVFALTYGDGVSDIDINDQLAFHRAHGRLATVTAVLPLKRFGALSLDKEVVTGFQEKPDGEGGLINGGFFLLSPKVGDRLIDDATVWERSPMESLARDDQLRAYIHDGFWHPMDTLRDKNYLEECWTRNEAAWKTW